MYIITKANSYEHDARSTVSMKPSSSPIENFTSLSLFFRWRGVWSTVRMAFRGRRVGYGRGFPRRAEDSYDGTIVRCVEVDSNLMGLVVGKEARNLRAIADRTNTRVYARRFERNRIYIEGNSRESVDNAEIEIKRSATNARKRVGNAGRRDLWSLGMKVAGGRGHLCFRDAGQCRQHACYRLVSSPEAEDEYGDEGLDFALPNSAKGTLDDFRKQYGKEGASACFSIWFHIGQIHVGGLDSDTDDRRRVFAPLEAQKFMESPKRFRHFDGGIEKGLEDIEKLKAYLEKNAKHVQSYVRHDVAFASPSGKKISFKVWVPTEGVRNEEPGTELMDRYTGSEKVVGTKIVKAGPGLLCVGLTDTFRGDIAFPDLPYDCRLLVKAGSTASPDVNEDELDTLLCEFCDRVEVDGCEIHMPLPPDGFKIVYERRSNRSCFQHMGFVVTLSDDKEVDKAHQDETREKIDVKVESQVCDALLERGDWTSEQLMPDLLAALNFIRELSGYIS
ncbi:uncharacterized protein [Oscarella lobularis]|uniref:uncharacterized protein n=1 Tax=Oscarella lobularis TaxID=121494 RepID=UPI0033137399